MSVREHLYSSLVKELLGPRTGVDEIMEENPRNEYMTGILEPKDFQHGALQDYSVSDIGTYASEDEGEEDRNERPNDFDLYPYIGLHPLALPKSMGISFVISSESTPIIDFCVTWARYRKYGRMWKRHSCFLIQRGVDISANNPPWMHRDDLGVKIGTK